MMTMKNGFLNRLANLLLLVKRVSEEREAKQQSVATILVASLARYVRLERVANLPGVELVEELTHDEGVEDQRKVLQTSVLAAEEGGTVLQEPRQQH